MTWHGETQRHRDVQAKGALETTLRAPLQKQTEIIFSGEMWHGTSEENAEKILSTKEFKPSKYSSDDLEIPPDFGEGSYFDINYETVLQYGDTIIKSKTTRPLRLFEAKTLSDKGFVQENWAGLNQVGLDGAIYRSGGGDNEIVIFNPKGKVVPLYDVGQTDDENAYSLNYTITPQINSPPPILLPIKLKKQKYTSAKEFVSAHINAYHWSQSKEPITDFKQRGEKGYKPAYYSQAVYGIYFSPSKELVQSKYGKQGGHLVEAHLIMNNPLDLGTKDAMYFDGRIVNSGDSVGKNFKRYMRGLPPIPEPDILVHSISKKARDWILKHGYDSVQGMKGEMWSAPEYVVFDPKQIITKQQLIDMYNRKEQS